MFQRRSIVLSGYPKKKRRPFDLEFFDRTWTHQSFPEPQKIPKAFVHPPPPDKIEEMWTIADKLAAGKPFIRVDLFFVNDTVYARELTFSPTGGLGGFRPIELDLRLGELITLPSEINE